MPRSVGLVVVLGRFFARPFIVSSVCGMLLYRVVGGLGSKYSYSINDMRKRTPTIGEIVLRSLGGHVEPAFGPAVSGKPALWAGVVDK